MASNAELYLDQLTDLFGRESAIEKVEPLVRGGRPIFVFYFEDLPEDGTLTAVTYGLSEARHPDWKYGRPELIVSLDTEDRKWGSAAGFFASSFQGIRSFCYGDLFTLNEPIADESAMVGYFLFAPSFLDQEQATISLPDYDVHLAGMYPIYREEIELYRRIGLKSFWHTDGFDMYDVNRPNLAIGD